MKKRGFWKQKDGIFRPHPNCNCLWINILIDESLKYAMQEREKIIQKAKEENTRQKGHKYAKADACGTQADELASAIYNLNLAFWSPKVVLGTKMNTFSLYREKSGEEKEGKCRLLERCVNHLRFSTVSIAAAREKRERWLSRSGGLPPLFGSPFSP